MNDVPERMHRRRWRWWQGLLCFIEGHDWSRSPWCEICGRLEHYS